MADSEGRKGGNEEGREEWVDVWKKGEKEGWINSFEFAP